MDFHVIYFDYDSQITAVNSSKVQSKEDVLKPGERCTVPFETEDLLEDGRTKYRDVLYEGTVICLNLVKKKAVELARKAQKDLDSGMSLLSIINKLQDQGKKRDSAAKLAEAIENLNEEEPKAKKVKKSDTEDKVKGSKKSKKTKPEKSADQPSTSNAKRSAIHPQKLAEISALLGDEEEFAVSQIRLASKPNNFSSEACRLTEKEQVSLPSSSLSTTLPTDSGPTTPQKLLINLETPRRSPRLSASKGETPRRLTNPQTESRAACYVSTPSARNSAGTQRHTDGGPKTPKKMLAILETPRRSPLLSAYKGENPRRMTYPQTESRAAYCESTPNSTSTQRSLLYEDETPSVCNESQWDGTFVNSFNVLDWNERERDSTPICSQSSDFGTSTSFRSFSEQQDNGPTPPVHHQSQQAHDLCVLLGITPREAAIASKVLQRMSFILSDAHDSTYEGDNGLGSSLYCTPERMSSFRTEIESSPLISKLCVNVAMTVNYRE